MLKQGLEQEQEFARWRDRGKQRRACRVPPMVPLLSVVFATALNNYEYKPKDEVQVDDSGTQLPLHLLLGITNEGQMKFLERIDFIRWTREEDTNEYGRYKYTAAAASKPGGWVYNEKYDRSKYQKAIGWVDERWGRVEKHKAFVRVIKEHVVHTIHAHMSPLLKTAPTCE